MGEKQEKIGNWGRWGDKDERGSLNFITPKVVKQAARLVRAGKVYSLGIPIQRQGVPVSVPELHGWPFHFMRLDGGDYAAGLKPFKDVKISDDFIFLGTHGTTHMDALCHIWCEDKLYNGFSGSTVRSSGAKYCGIDKVSGIVGRGILLDVAREKDVDHLEKGYAITSDDLEKCAKKQGIHPRSGDILLVRTGWLSHYAEEPETWEQQQPGLGVSSLPWMIENEISVVGADNAMLEVWPAEDEKTLLPVHAELLRNRGVYIMEFLNLDELARDHIYEFLFVATPLKITGGTGSPLSPLAIV